MNKIGIRFANSDDALSIERLEKQMDHEVYSLNMIKDSLADKNYYNIVAVIDDVVVAYLSAMNVACESSLLKIIVDNNFKRQGIGCLLMKEYLKYLEGIDCQKVFLEVRKDNDAAIKLYEYCGFEKQGERKGYYHNCDACIYIKVIGDK